MKKTICMLMLIPTLLFAMTVSAFAIEYKYKTDTSTDFYELDAVKVDEVYAEEAGVATTKWTVPYLRIKPKLDGKISTNEYARFENYEDYLFYSMRINGGNNSPKEFEAFLNATVEGFFDAYWGWDGQYLYLAFDMDCVDGYFCDPVGKYGGSSYLYACTSVQVGLGAPDCSGRDYTELGFGIQEDDKGLTQRWIGLGSYYPNASTDVAGEYDEERNQLIIEFRIDVQRALDLDNPVFAGDQIKLCWLLQVSGSGDNLKSKTVSFCHGIGGTQSYKRGEYFATVTFGDESEVTENTTEVMTTIEEPLTTVGTTTEEVVTVPLEDTTKEDIDGEKVTDAFDSSQLPEDIFTEPSVPVPDEMFKSGGLIQRWWSLMQKQGCFSATSAVIMPLVAVLGVAFLKRKDDES